MVPKGLCTKLSHAPDAANRAANAAHGAMHLLAPGESIDAIVPFLPELSLVALAFPAFNDGRSFSKAELLRSRHGYEGAMRATGQVLVDQLPQSTALLLFSV